MVGYYFFYLYDAAAAGFIHSCNVQFFSPFLRIIDGETRIGIFATRDIQKGEHLTYDYQYEHLPVLCSPFKFWWCWLLLSYATNMTLAGWDVSNYVAGLFNLVQIKIATVVLLHVGVNWVFDLRSLKCLQMLH